MKNRSAVGQTSMSFGKFAPHFLLVQCFSVLVFFLTYFFVIFEKMFKTMTVLLVLLCVLVEKSASNCPKHSANNVAKFKIFPQRR